MKAIKDTGPSQTYCLDSNHLWAKPKSFLFYRSAYKKNQLFSSFLPKSMTLSLWMRCFFYGRLSPGIKPLSKANYIKDYKIICVYNLFGVVILFNT
jgi:hypothetical protein